MLQDGVRGPVVAPFRLGMRVGTHYDRTCFVRDGRGKNNYALAASRRLAVSSPRQRVAVLKFPLLPPHAPASTVPLHISIKNMLILWGV